MGFKLLCSDKVCKYDTKSQASIGGMVSIGLPGLPPKGSKPFITVLFWLYTNSWLHSRGFQHNLTVYPP